VIIAQISDTHILPRDTELPQGRSRSGNLRRTVAYINRLRPDAVVHTGDTTQHGAPEEYDHLRALLAPLEAPLYLVPGNRDKREALRAAFAERDDLFEEGDFAHYTVEDTPVRFVALDSIEPGDRKGVFCAARQAWLEATLGRAPERPTVLLIHHPPFDIDDHYLGGYRHPRQREELAAVVARHPQVVRMLCGHVHVPAHRDWAGTLATVMPSIAVDVRKYVDPVQAKDAPMYHVHVVTPGAGLVSHTRVVTG
jgi:3',5'-cyclic AMP phosphodiesterase CpdA